MQSSGRLTAPLILNVRSRCARPNGGAEPSLSTAYLFDRALIRACRTNRWSESRLGLQVEIEPDPTSLSSAVRCK